MTNSFKDLGEVKYWGALVLLLFLVIFWTVSSIQHNKENRIQELKQNYSANIAFLKNRIQIDLQNGDYDGINTFLNEWAKYHLSSVLSLKLTSNNGYVINNYSRDRGSDKPVKFTTNISYSYDKHVIFDFVGDLSPLDAEFRSMYWSYSVTILLFTIGLIIITILFLKRRRLARELQNNSAHLLSINKELERIIRVINESSVTAFLWKNETNWPIEWVSQNVKELTGYTADEYISGTATHPSLHRKTLWRSELKSGSIARIQRVNVSPMNHTESLLKMELLSG